MNEPREKLERCLLCYGADLSRWPEEARQEGVKALRDAPELQALVADHQRLERFLQDRSCEAPRPDLAERIIAASLRERKEAARSLQEKILELVGWSGLRQPVLVALVLLVISSFVVGFIAGFAGPADQIASEQTQVALQEYLYYEGELL